MNECLWGGGVPVQILDIFAFMFMLYPRYIRQALFVDFYM
jgi:hypothetical protein